MKLIIAIIQPEELPEIKEELIKEKFISSLLPTLRGREKKYPYKRFTEAFLMK